MDLIWLNHETRKLNWISGLSVPLRIWLLLGVRAQLTPSYINGIAPIRKMGLHILAHFLLGGCGWRMMKMRGKNLVFFGIKLGKFEAFREDVPEILGLIYGFKIWFNQEKWWLWIPLNGWRTFCSLVDGAWSNTSVLWPPHTHGDLSHNHDVLIVSGCLGVFLDFYTSWSRPPKDFELLRRRPKPR